MSTRLVLWSAAGLLAASLVLARARGGEAPASASAPASTLTPPPALVAERPPLARAPAAPVAASSTAPAPARAVAPAAFLGLPPTLDVELEGRPLSWTLEQIRAVPRAGGTHDLRELTSALLGVTDVTVQLEGLQEGAGARHAKIDLGRLGAADQVRVWPELDGTWTIARNRTSADSKDTREVYRLTGVRILSFSRHS